MNRNWIKDGVAVLLIVLSLLVVTDQVHAQTAEEQSRSISNWKTALVGTEFSETDTDLMPIIDAQEQSYKNDIESKLSTDPSSGYLFSDIGSTWNTAQMSTMAVRIKAMAFLYQTNNSVYYKDNDLKQKIEYSLKWFYDNVYNENTTYSELQWYDYRIGVPLNLVDALALMKGEISDSVLQNSINSIDYFEPDDSKDTSFSSGANRMDQAFVVAMLGVISGEQKQIDLATQVLQYSFNTVTPGVLASNDGFYKDGTFIQHRHTPYTSGYGATYLSRSAELFKLFAGTSQLAQFKTLKSMYTYLDTTYLPVLYKNEVLDMTRGRGISLQSVANEDVANAMLYDMYTISQKNGDSAYRGRYNKILKSSIIASSSKADFYKKLPLPVAQTFKSIVLNTNISGNPVEMTPQNIMMASGSQMIDRRAKYTASISMFSKEISSFEYISGANKFGFYTGTGALSLYNGDESLKGNYYPTLDDTKNPDGTSGQNYMTSLPGTTTDHKIGELINTDTGLNSPASYPNTESWSGGVSDGQNGSASLDYSMEKVTGSSLKAQKSWFFLDDRIVALGTGITSSENLDTETIVENRQLINNKTNALNVTGQTLLDGQDKTITDARWANLKGATASQNIGYVFFNPTTVNAFQKEKSGNWNALNTHNKSLNVTADYAGISIPHGKNPEDASYSYMIIPGLSEAETEDYYNHSFMNTGIIVNDPRVQGVADKVNNLFMLNYFKSGSLTYESDEINFYMSAATPGSIMFRKSAADNTKTVTISDPTKEQDKIEFSIDKVAGDVLQSNSDGVTVVDTGDNWKVSADTSAHMGESFNATFTNPNTAKLLAAPKSSISTSGSVAVQKPLDESTATVRISDSSRTKDTVEWEMPKTSKLELDTQSLPSNVRVEELGEAWHFYVDTSEHTGETFTINFK